MHFALQVPQQVRVDLAPVQGALSDAVGHDFHGTGPPRYARSAALLPRATRNHVMQVPRSQHLHLEHRPHAMLYMARVRAHFPDLLELHLQPIQALPAVPGTLPPRLYPRRVYSFIPTFSTAQRAEMISCVVI